MVVAALRFSLSRPACRNIGIIIIEQKLNINAGCKSLQSHSAPARQVIANDLHIISRLLKFFAQPLFEIFELHPVV
jgi:hypothetical protein